MIELITSMSSFFFMWQWYADLSGKVDGYLFDALTAKKDASFDNLHPLFTLIRAIIGCAVLKASIDLGGIIIGWDMIWLIAMLCLSYIGTFSYWHNGKYYVTRNKLNPNVYKKGWFDYSSTSRATFDLSYKERLSGLIIGWFSFVGAIIEVLIN